MRLAGNIQQIRYKRDSKNEDVVLYISKIEYITQKKDGRYYQPFEFVDELDTPVTLTGDCLQRINDPHLPEGTYEFEVFDKVGDAYELNPGKQLQLTVEYDFDTNQSILSSLSYQITVTNEEFKQLKSDRAKAKASKKGRGRK